MSTIISLITIILLVTMIIFKPVIKIKGKEIQSFWIVALLGAILLIIFGEVTIKEMQDIFFVKGSMNPFKILVLFISISLLSLILDEAGFFKKCANLALKYTNGKQLTLFLTISLIVSILTIFTSNDIVILTFTPFICYFAKNAKISPIPYLIAEFVFANTWSMLLIIGNPTNIYLATSFDIDFFEYFKIMVVPTFITGISALFIMLFIFRKQLSIKITSDSLYEEVKLNRFVTTVGVVHLVICTIMLAISSYINFDMWLICLVFACSIIIFLTIYYFIKKDDVIFKSIKRLPYNLIPFISSMFIIVFALTKVGVIEEIANKLDMLALSSEKAILSEGLSSYLSCNILNNIPMSVMYEKIISSSNGLYTTEKIYSSIISSNIGAYLTPVGALAGIMWMGILNKTGLKFGFKDFIKHGIILSPILILIALSSLMIIL